MTLFEELDLLLAKAQQRELAHDVVILAKRLHVVVNEALLSQSEELRFADDYLRKLAGVHDVLVHLFDSVHSLVLLIVQENGPEFVTSVEGLVHERDDARFGHAEDVVARNRLEEEVVHDLGGEDLVLLVDYLVQLLVALLSLLLPGL